LNKYITNQPYAVVIYDFFIRNFVLMEKSTFNKELGQFIRSKRNQLNWSQSQLASELGNNSQNISRIERGELSPTLYWITKLARAFDMTLAGFISEFDQSIHKN